MKTTLLILAMSSAALAQAPAKPLKAFALNANMNERYSLTRSVHEVSPSISVDYRIVPRLRVGVGYSHTFTLNPPAAPPYGPAPATQGNNLILSLNYKLFEWGKAR